MIAALATRSWTPGTRRLLLAAGAAVILAAAAAPSDLGPVVARAGLAVATLAAVLVMARRRDGATAAAPALAVVARAALGRDTGVALVALEGRRLLVGFGPEGVRLLEGDRQGEEAP